MDTKEVAKELEKEGFDRIEAGEVWDFEKDPIMRGVFLSVEENVGENNSNLYSFEHQGGNIVSVWGSEIIDARLKNVEMGEEVVIIYHGKVPSKKRKNSFYKNFEIYHKKPGEKVEEEEA